MSTIARRPPPAAHRGRLQVLRRQARAREHRPRGQRRDVLLGRGAERLRQVDAVPARARAGERRRRGGVLHRRQAGRRARHRPRHRLPALFALSAPDACSRTWCSARTLRVPLARAAGGGAREFRDEAMQYLERVAPRRARATSIRTSSPAACSSASRSRRRCITRPRVLMMDEPFGALDPETREAMQVFLLELWEEQRMTIFFVTHDMEEAVYLGTRVLVLSQHYIDDRGARASSAARASSPTMRCRAPCTRPRSRPAPSSSSSIAGDPPRRASTPTTLRHVREFNLQPPRLVPDADRRGAAARDHERRARPRAADRLALPDHRDRDARGDAGARSCSRASRAAKQPGLQRLVGGRTACGGPRTGASRATPADPARGAARRSSVRAGPASTCWLDFHPFLEQPGATCACSKEIAQRLRARAAHAGAAWATQSTVPPELEKLTVRFGLSLPDADAIQGDRQGGGAAWQARHGGAELQGRARGLRHAAAASLRACAEVDVRRLVRARDRGRRLHRRDGPAAAASTQQARDARQRQRALVRDRNRALLRRGRAGDPEALARAAQARAFLGDAAALGLDVPKGIMLLGVQGCGKSLAAKAVAGAWGVPLMRLDFGALYNKFLGETERNLREALKVADAMAPCVLWIDEIEKGVATNDDTTAASRGASSARCSPGWPSARAGVPGRDLERHRGAAARAGAQGPAGRDLLRRPARRRRRARRSSASISKRRKQDPAAFDLPALVAKTRGLLGRGDRAGGGGRALRGARGRESRSRPRTCSPRSRAPSPLSVVMAREDRLPARVGGGPHGEGRLSDARREARRGRSPHAWREWHVPLSRGQHDARARPTQSLRAGRHCAARDSVHRAAGREPALRSAGHRDVFRRDRTCAMHDYLHLAAGPRPAAEGRSVRARLHDGQHQPRRRTWRSGCSR